MRQAYPIVHLDEIIGFRAPRDSHATRFHDAGCRRHPVRCFAPATSLAMLAAGAAHAPSFATVSCCLHPCARTRLLRAQLDAPDDGLDDDYLDRQVSSLSRNAHRARPAHLYPPPQTRALARSSRSRLEAASRTGAARSSTGASPSTRSALRHEIAPPTRSARCLPLPSYPAALPWP